MNESERIYFINKIIEERQKRKNIIAEADKMVEAIESHYQLKKEEAKCIDVERIELWNELHDIAKSKDISRLEELFERLE